MPTAIPATPIVLFDLSGSLSTDNEFRGLDGTCACYYQIVKENPLSTKITLMPDWVATKRHISEPWVAWLYFTSNTTTSGYIQIGTGEPTPMTQYLRTQSPQSSSTYFTGSDRRLYNWRPASRAFHCYNEVGTLVASYQYCSEEAVFARLDIKVEALHMVTEIIATLLLNRHAIQRASS
ncbi:hypothetical protein DL93DRAFT_425375 [Clavulina sp. PMI_390]|nr:hypothetical protein DL93DRAFT_425375 [Clavulina sp. PMI_390]